MSEAPVTELAVAKAPHAAPAESGIERTRRFFWPGGLSARLLLLTILFVSVAELLILAPSLASFEVQWLTDRVRRGEMASVTYDVAADRAVSERVRDQLRTGSGLVQLAFTTKDANNVRTRNLLFEPDAPVTPYRVDLAAFDRNFAEWLAAPFRTLLGGKDRMVLTEAPPRFRTDVESIEIVADDAELKNDMRAYLLRLLAVTLFIAVVAGGLVYVSLNLLLVKPMQRITLAMERFRADPEDPKSHIEPSGRRDEIGRAEAELDRMQADLRVALTSRARLAALGEAVAKINHDLRNMLTSAQIASERLALSGDPGVAQVLPRLERALDRAVGLASNVLAYGRSEEAVPNTVHVAVKAAMAAAAEDARLGGGVRLRADLKASDRIIADPDQLHRILLNLLKNARQAIQGSPSHDGRGVIDVRLERRPGPNGGISVLAISDNGPGLPERVVQNLFQPFAATGRSGGTGLGLAIARELAQGHGGDLALVANGPDGAVFELSLPGVIEPPVRRKGP